MLSLLSQYSTAEKLSGCLNIDDRLRERELGNPETLNAAFWIRQYEDHNYKNADGESLNDAKERMTANLHQPRNKNRRLSFGRYGASSAERGLRAVEPSNYISYIRRDA